VTSGEISEIFACGTAAVVTPVGQLSWSGGSLPSPTPTEGGSVAMRLREQLVGIQLGTVDDAFGWLHRVV